MRRVKNSPPGPPWLRDTGGGALVLRGTNVSGAAKQRGDRLPPCEPADFRRLGDELGMNAVRLLCFWEAVEPEPGAYDRAYLARLRELAEAAGSAGLHVVIDMHQDLWGSAFGSAGAPRWCFEQRAYEGFRPPSELGWFTAYFTPQVTRCFDAFWRDVELQDAFASAWVEVVGALRGTPGLLALDLFNEPFWGSIPLTRFETRVLPDLYARVIEAVRRVGWDGWVALEPAPIVNIGYPSRLRPPSRDRVLLAPHFYPPLVEAGLGYAGAREALGRQLGRLRALASRQGLPLVIGEVGVRRRTTGARPYLDDFYDLADARAMGCLQWDFGRGGDGSYALFDRDGEHTELSRAVARPTPRRVAGTPVGWRHDRREGRFELRWREDAGARGATEVAAPLLAFPGGFDAEVRDGGAIELGESSVRVPARGGDRTLVLSAR